MYKQKDYDGNEIEMIVTVPIDDYWQKDADTVASLLIEQNKKYGFKIFALSAPCSAWYNIGYTPKELFVEKANLFAKIKERVAPYGIICSLWIATTLNSGYSPDINSFVDINGKISKGTGCPLDETFIKRFSENIATFAKIAKPAFMFTEDDFSSRRGCFCEHHLKEFAKRTGKYYSREELVAKFDEDLDLLKSWRKFSKEAMISFAKRIRQEVDKESPEIPIGYDQPGYCDIEDDCTEEMSRALAGDKHIPFSRLFSGLYEKIAENQIPEILFHSLYSKEHIKGNFKYIHETDTYPYTRFFNSGKELNALMGVAYSYGFDGSIYQAVPYFTENPDMEPAWGEIYAQERVRLNALYRTAKKCNLKGVQICYDPFYNSISEPRPLWVRTLGLYGIPYTTLDSDVAFWDKVQAQYADDKTVREYLSKGLFLDGDAAKILCERGYKEFIGVDIGEEANIGTNNPELNVGEFDQNSQEIICDKFIDDSGYNDMPNPRTYCPQGNGILYKMTPISPKCEIISNVYSYQHDLISVAMTRFENTLGGRVVTMGVTLKGNCSQNLMNYTRQRIIQENIRWCSDKYAFVKGCARVTCIMNEAVDDDFIGMLTIVSHCPDDHKNAHIYLPEKWRAAKEFLYLDIDGEWKKLDCKITEDGICLNIPVTYLIPIYIMAK